MFYRRPAAYLSQQGLEVRIRMKVVAAAIAADMGMIGSMDRWDWLPSSMVTLWAASLQPSFSAAEGQLQAESPTPPRLYDETALLDTNTMRGIVARLR
jgi:hypothetical protein